MDERVKLLAGQMETWYKSMSEFVFKHSTFQLVILGWIVSFNDTIFADAEAFIRYTTVIALLLYSAFASGVYWELRNKSSYCFERLACVDVRVADDCKRFLITPKFLWSSILVHFAISIVSGWLVFMVSA